MKKNKENKSEEKRKKEERERNFRSCISVHKTYSQYNGNSVINNEWLLLLLIV